MFFSTKKKLLKAFCSLFMLIAPIIHGHVFYSTNGYLDKTSLSAIECLISRERLEKMRDDTEERKKFVIKTQYLCFAASMGCWLGSCYASIVGCDKQVAKKLQVAGVSFFMASLALNMPLHSENKQINDLMELDKDRLENIGSL